jgi:Kef-type K+ transport system membrane component KefB/mannitol/fructose-specific phosphotransferase system IIA component
MMHTLAAGILTPYEITIFLLSLAVLLGVARLFGEIAKRFGQPTVLGEILAGVILGATVLGNFAPDIYQNLFPEYLADHQSGEPVYYDKIDPETGEAYTQTITDPTTGQPIQVTIPDKFDEKGNPNKKGRVPSLVKVGLEAFFVLAVCLLLLVAGLEVDLSIVTKQGKAAVLVSVLGMVIPFAVGAGVAYLLAIGAPKLIGFNTESGMPVPFALFLGIAMSITALPVIAKILMDLNMLKSDMGMLIMSSAMVNDLLGWIGFALVLAMIIPESESALSLEFVIPATFIFVGFMLFAGRWIAHRTVPWIQAHSSWPGGILGFVFVIALLCAALTEWIGIHAIFGAFLAGIALGDTKHLTARTRETIEQIVTYIFAPIFFAGVALRVDFYEGFNFAVIVIVLVIAIIGKVVGCYLGAKLANMSTRECWAIGFGMSARGAMEIILAQIALSFKLIDQELFVAIVIMAIVTSVIAGPLMQKALDRRQQKRFVDLLTSKAFITRLKAVTRRDAIRELAKVAATITEIDADTIETAVWQREQTMSTGIGNGVAVPHGRIEGLAKPQLIVGICPPGIDFDAGDGMAAEIVCMLLTSADDQLSQIEMLRAVAEAFGDPARRRSAVEAEGYTEFRAAIAVGSAPAH